MKNISERKKKRKKSGQKENRRNIAKLEEEVTEKEWIPQEKSAAIYF